MLNRCMLQKYERSLELSLTNFAEAMNNSESFDGVYLIAAHCTFNSTSKGKCVIS